MTPTQRSLKKLRDEGWLVEVVEKWLPKINIRKDLFGFGDLLAVRGDIVLIVQTTTGSNAAARVAKIRALPAHATWLAGWPSRQIIVHSWAKRGERGKRKLWDCVVIPIIIGQPQSFHHD